jgi:hypothetical protein
LPQRERASPGSTPAINAIDTTPAGSEETTVLVVNVGILLNVELVCFTGAYEGAHRTQCLAIAAAHTVPPFAGVRGLQMTAARTHIVIIARQLHGVEPLRAAPPAGT